MKAAHPNFVVTRSPGDCGLAIACRRLTQPAGEARRPSTAEQRVCRASLSSTDVLRLTQSLVTVPIPATPTKELSDPASRLSEERDGVGHPSKHLPTAAQHRSPFSNRREALLVKRGGEKKSSMFSHNIPIPRVLLRSCQLEGFSSLMITYPSVQHDFSLAPRRPSAAKQPAMVTLPATWVVGFPHV